MSDGLRAMAFDSIGIEGHDVTIRMIATFNLSRSQICNTLKADFISYQGRYYETPKRALTEILLSEIYGPIELELIEAKNPFEELLEPKDLFVFEMESLNSKLKKIDKETPFEHVEPKWWLKMMEIKKMAIDSIAEFKTTKNNGKDSNADLS